MTREKNSAKEKKKMRREPPVRGKSAPLKIKNDGYKNKSKNISGGNVYAKEKAKETANTDSVELPVNKYYFGVSYALKFAKWILGVFLALFVAAGVIFNSGELSADNLGYLFDYINIQVPAAPGKSEFYIELDEMSSVCYYKNNIAVLRKNRLDIYDINGRKNFSSGLVYSNPVLKTSDRYILAYDLGMNKLEIFNVYARVYEYKETGPIYGAQVTDMGNVVYITSEKGYQSVVYVMNRDLKNVFECRFGEDFIVNADINDGADMLAVAGFSARDGDYLSRVILYKTNSKKPVKEIEITGEQPYGVKLNEHGVFAVFENSFMFYDLNGNYVSSYDFERRKIKFLSLTHKLSAVVLNEKSLGTNDRILIFDGGGNILYENAFGEEITDIKFSEDYKFLYFLTHAGLNKIDISQKNSVFVTDEFDETTDNIVYANEKNIYLSGLLKINIIKAD